MYVNVLVNMCKKHIKNKIRRNSQEQGGGGGGGGGGK